MTVAKLIKELEKLQKQFGARTEVVVDLQGTINNKLDYWHSHISVNTIQQDTICWFKDDDCLLADGSERMKSVIVLNGE